MEVVGDPDPLEAGVLRHLRLAEEVAGPVLLRGQEVAERLTTTAGGSYSFANLTAGDYLVVETDLTGYVSTTPNSVCTMP